MYVTYEMRETRSLKIQELRSSSQLAKSQTLLSWCSICRCRVKTNATLSFPMSVIRCHFEILPGHMVSQESQDVHAWIMLNDRHKIPLRGDKRCGHGTASQSVLLQLKRGDHVWMELSKTSALQNDFSTFSGFLIFEDWKYILPFFFLLNESFLYVEVGEINILLCHGNKFFNLLRSTGFHAPKSCSDDLSTNPENDLQSLRAFSSI